MGFITGVRDRLRRVFYNDKEQQAHRVAQGTRGPALPASGLDILYSYGYGAMADYFRLQQDLLTRYADYEEMDEYGELNAALDIFADDATQPDAERNRTVWVTSENEQIETMLNNLFWRELRIDEDIWSITRTAAKYGNDFEEILIGQNGVMGLNFLPTPTMRRVEGHRGDLYGFLQDFRGTVGYTRDEFYKLLHDRDTGQGIFARQTDPDEEHAIPDLTIPFEPWEIAHFRLGGRFRRSPYGLSILEPARWLWRRLVMLEDAALIYRLERAPERLAFYVDVGDMPPPMARAEMNKLRQEYRKRRIIDPTTGKPSMKFEVIAQQENIFIPVRGDKRSSEIEVLGAPAWQAMDDIQYFQSKLFAAIKIPKVYLGQEEGVVRSILSNEDVRFARTVLRIQRELINGLGKVARVHLAAIGIDPESVEYEIRMTVPSAIFELAQMEVRNARADLMSKMESHFPMEWLMKDIFHMTDDDIEEVMIQRGEDVVREASWTAYAQAEGAKYQPQGGDPTALTPDGAGFSDPVPPAQQGDGGAPMGGDMGGGMQGEEEEEVQVPRYLLNSKGKGVSRPPSRRGSPRWRSRHPRGVPPMTRREIESGGGARHSSRAMQAKLEKVLSNDSAMAVRLYEIQRMLHELRGAGRRR